MWLVLHSGSRGIGNQLAQAHIATARRLARDLYRRLEDPDLAYFVEGTPEFASYITDMLWALVDEIPSAYKDIDRVMSDQKDLMTVLHTLRQVLNYKGT